MWLRSSEAGSGGYRAFYCLCLICLWHFTTPSFLVLITQPYILLCSLESWSLPCGVPGQWHTKRQENVGVDLTVGVCVPVAEYLSSRSLLSHPPSLWFFSVNRWRRDSDLIHPITLSLWASSALSALLPLSLYISSHLSILCVLIIPSERQRIDRVVFWVCFFFSLANCMWLPVLGFRNVQTLSLSDYVYYYELFSLFCSFLNPKFRVNTFCCSVVCLKSIQFDLGQGVNH